MTTRREDVDVVFRRLALGDFSKPIELAKSGWKMQLPSGEDVLRSTLQAEAAPLIVQGPEAVPHLLRCAMDENLALRYVALYALEQITGEKPYVPYFDQADSEGHREKAMEVWRTWYQRQPK
jgi:hypothetical protein